MIIVSELIKFLEKQRPNTVVSVDGYEGGITDHVFLKVEDVAVNTCDGEALAWEGEHERVSNMRPGDASAFPIEKRVIISRRMR
jgi:hypothetical protein